jgi:hypothetical protein
MIPETSIITVLSIVAFLGIAASGLLAVLIASIHRAGNAPLSQSHDHRAGAISRRVLTGSRTMERQ